MKKLLSVFLLAFVLALSACGSDEPEKETPKAEETPKKDEVKKESNYPYPENDEEAGEGGLYLESEVLFVDSDTLLTQFGYEIEDFDNDKEAFFYLNEHFVEAIQGGDVMSSIDLSDWMLQPGEYELVAVQFEDNDPENNVINLSKAKYKVEEGS